jgi:hypothetical protein
MGHTNWESCRLGSNRSYSDCGCVRCCPQMKQRVAGFHTGNQGWAQQQQQQAASSVQRWFSLLPGVSLQDRPPWGLRGGPDKSTGQLQKAEAVLAVLRQQLRTEEMLEMIQMRLVRHANPPPLGGGGVDMHCAGATHWAAYFGRGVRGEERRCTCGGSWQQTECVRRSR